MTRILLCESACIDPKWKILSEDKMSGYTLEKFKAAAVLLESKQDEASEKLMLEAVDSMKGKVLKVQGRFQKADELNANKRKYPFSILQREVARLQPLIKMRRLLGELDHPEILETMLRNVSHLISELRMEGDEVIGVMEVLPTANGNTLRSLYESKVDVGVSSRGAGSVQTFENYSMIGEDFFMKTFDAVSDPSTPDAYPKMTNEIAKLDLKNYGMLKEQQLILAGIY